jgi:hypothetical protein
MKKWYVIFLCKRLINGAQKSVGLKYKKVKVSNTGKFNLGDVLRNPWRYSFCMIDEYETLNKTTDKPYIVIGSGIYKYHAYSNDPREPGVFKEFDNFINVVEFCAERVQVVATNISMRKDKNFKETIGVMTHEEFTNWSNLLQAHEKKVKLKLSKYLNGAVPKFINWQIMKLTQNA